MKESSSRRHPGPEIREQYDEYDVGETVVGVITDPENEHAWIWSDVVASPEC